MDRHASLLAILIGLWGALAILVGLSMLILSGGALAMMSGREGANVEFAAGITAGALVVIGSFLLLWGGVHVWAGLLLKRRRAFGRVLALALAVANLVVLPFGTALGVYSLWVLLTNDGRRLFEPTSA